ncbi:hypothetical protein PIIN_04644 [Serendipita indica DSM 11827]|uniref:Uncharacterized protein n=1 Tax=Serendipita indica (strain DSM 11827) TaxID=1109443 RepID=G4THB7_SERID|nr:hypothetical protein PIIN_04644 [Serendipita indica DSM 11827]
MYSYTGPRPPPVNWHDDPRRDAIWDDGVEDDEAYDEFDPTGNAVEHYTTNSYPRQRSSRVPGARRPGKRRAVSVESTHSASTSGHFITSSQAASPGDTTGFVDLSEDMEKRVARVLDPTFSPTLLSPRLAPQPVTPLQGPYESSLYREQHITVEPPKKYWRLPSFRSLLQSVGESTTLPSPTTQQSQLPPMGHYEAAGATTSHPRQPYSAHNSTHLHNFAAHDGYFDPPLSSVESSPISSRGAMKRHSQRAYSSDTETVSRALIPGRLPHERHTSEPPPMYPESADRRQSLPHIFDPLPRNYQVVSPQATGLRPLPQLTRPYSAPPVSRESVQPSLRGLPGLGHSQVDDPRPEVGSEDRWITSSTYSLEAGYDSAPDGPARTEESWLDDPHEQAVPTSSRLQAEYVVAQPPSYYRASSVGSVGYTTSAESPPGTPVKLYSKLPKNVS